jgi:hypothetical protein
MEHRYICLKNDPMKKLFTFVLVIILTAVLSIVLYDRFAGENELPSNVVKATMYSEILKEDREVIIHLPIPYDSNTRYPTVYVLDGGSDDRNIATQLDVLSTAGYVSPAIVVGIPNMSGENRQRNLTPPFMRMDNDDPNSSMGEAHTFLSFLEKELIPYVERKYPVTQERMLSGNSRGGLLAMYSLISHASLFSARFCHSTPYWRQDDILISKVSEYMRAQDTLHTFIYLSAGKAETENIKGGLARMQKALETHAPAGMVWHADYMPQATHQDNGRRACAKGIRQWSEYVKKP